MSNEGRPSARPGTMRAKNSPTRRNVTCDKYKYMSLKKLRKGYIIKSTVALAMYKSEVFQAYNLNWTDQNVKKNF